MESLQLKRQLQMKAREMGIDKIGFASAEPFNELRERLRDQQNQGYASGFEEPNIEKRVDPAKSLPGVQTIIAIALAYPSRLKSPPQSTPSAYRGVFCRASWGKDYHHVLREKLEKLSDYLSECVPNCHTQVMVDTGALSDRAVAERAGIGWSGKNTSIITEEFGSWVYLGELLTDVYIPPDTPVVDGCADCRLCIDACPTGALVQGGQLNAQACIAYLTQTKEIVPKMYRKKIGNRLYGCDTCQVVCPKNKGMHFDHHPELEPDPEQVKPLLKPLLSLSNRQFKEQFGHMAGSWRGKRPIQRNAIIALAHFKDETAIPLLISLLLEDNSPTIRGTAAWALGHIGECMSESAEIQEALLKARQLETDQAVQQEIGYALQQKGVNENGGLESDGKSNRHTYSGGRP